MSESTGAQNSYQRLSNESANLKKHVDNSIVAIKVVSLVNVEHLYRIFFHLNFNVF